MPNLLMCKPTYFSIRYEINPWMKIQQKVDPSLAMLQWLNLCQIIKQCGGNIVELTPVENLPDFIFTANAGLRHERQIYLSRFRHPERQGEFPHFRRWFNESGFEVITEPEEFFDHRGHYKGPCFEGAGDALFLGETLFSGFGFRTDKEIYPYIYELLKIKKSVFCELVDPRFYHLDTCFCPLNEHQAIWYPQAFSKASQRQMADQADLFTITAEEELSFACNAVVINKNVVIPDRCPQTRVTLEKLGFTVYDCPMTEFIKSGGACKCLTLDLGDL